MIPFTIRNMHQPDDAEAVVEVLNTFLSEPTTAERLKEEDAAFPPDELKYNEEGLLAGRHRARWVAEDESGKVIGYAAAWRTPWTVPGRLYHLIVVRPEHHGNGIGQALHNTVLQWAMSVKASKLTCTVRDSDERAIGFAERRRYVKTRHVFESVLDLAAFRRTSLFEAIDHAERCGIRFVTLADEPGEASERKVYDLYRLTEPDIPGFAGQGYPPFEEWKKWNLNQSGMRPEWFHIAKDGDRFVGVAALKKNEQTHGMYHEYTGVLREYRGRRIALALKMLCIRTAIAAGAPYVKTHNDAANGPMLHINRDLIGFRSEPGEYRMEKELR